VPALHASEHVEAPVVAENIPAGQSKHATANKEMAPGVEYVPTWHATPEHVEAPVEFENLPAWHSWHAPSKHLETVLNLPASQGWHVPFLYSRAGGLPHCQISHEEGKGREFVHLTHNQGNACWEY